MGVADKHIEYTKKPKESSDRRKKDYTFFTRVYPAYINDLLSWMIINTKECEAHKTVDGREYLWGLQHPSKKCQWAEHNPEEYGKRTNIPPREEGSTKNMGGA